MDRRNAIRSLGILAFAGVNPGVSSPVLRPPRLRPGDTVGLINPAGATFLRDDIAIVRETLGALGLSVREGKHLLDRYGYLAGRDEDRAADIHALVDDPDVHALLAVRGGWGSARVLPHLEFDRIRRSAKIFLGYSDVTALLLAVTARTGLVTFHGPVGISTWNTFTVDYFRSVLMAGDAAVFRNPPKDPTLLAQTTDRIHTITPGTCRGMLFGGNLSVLTGLVGTPYLPDPKGKILFLEDDGEQIYRIDRMLTHLRLAGVLEGLSGCIFGACTGCGPGEGYGSLTLEEVLRDHFAPLGIPAWSGAMIGHIEKKFTIPIGLEAEADASAGTITLLEPGVR